MACQKNMGSLNEAMLREPHSPLDEHATADVVEESGLRELIRKEGLLKDSNYIVGTVAFGASMKKRPEFNLEKYDTFRMALSIYTASGEAIPDFFEGLPGASLDNPIVGDRPPHQDATRLVQNKGFGAQRIP